MNFKLKVFGGLALAAAVVTAAHAQGLWPTLPLVGGAAVCSSTSTGVSGQVCTTTTPAGPSVVTGSETIPADTNLSGGRSPQSVRLPMASLNALPVTVTSTFTPATAANALTATTTTGGFIVVGSGALSPTTISLPPSPIDGQEFKLSSTQTIATLTLLAPGGASISNNPTALTVSTTAAYGYQFRYNAAATTWYRLQ